jgi:hypothetical protein
VNVLTLLCDQIGISITNALLFKSLQKATQTNAQMIETQLKALEEARASREQALRATKMKSNFLANMCKLFFFLKKQTKKNNLPFLLSTRTSDTLFRILWHDIIIE